MDMLLTPKRVTNAPWKQDHKMTRSDGRAHNISSDIEMELRGIFQPGDGMMRVDDNVQPGIPSLSFLRAEIERILIVISLHGEPLYIPRFPQGQIGRR